MDIPAPAAGTPAAGAVPPRRTALIATAILVAALAIRLVVAIMFWGSEDVTVQIYHAWRIH